MQIYATIGLLAGLFSAVSSANPIDLEKRAPGPSGQVLSPEDGAYFATFSSYNTGLLHFQYETVSQYKDDCGAFECHLYTDYVQVSLRNLSDGKETTLASYLAPPPASPDDQTPIIDAYFRLPATGEGDYRLVVREFQHYYDHQIDFQAAAPLIHINFEPVP